MYPEEDFIFSKGKKPLDWCIKIIITIPALSISIWCIANTLYTALLYEHIRNILRNVTIHIEA